MSATAISIASPPDRPPSAPREHKDREKETEKDASTTASAAPVGKRRRDGQSLSDGALTSSSLTDPTLPEESKTPAKRPKRSLLSKLTRLCCINTQHTHPIDLDEGAAHLPDCEKHALADPDAAHGTHSSTSTTGECACPYFPAFPLQRDRG